MFLGGMFTIPSHGWFMALFFSHFIDFVVDQVLYLLRDGLLFGGENYQETPQFDGENTWCLL